MQTIKALCSNCSRNGLQVVQMGPGTTGFCKDCLYAGLEALGEEFEDDDTQQDEPTNGNFWSFMRTLAWVALFAFVAWLVLVVGPPIIHPH